MPEDIEKRGLIDENSAAPAIRLPTRISSIGIYYQPPGSHPNPRELPLGMEVVEVVTGGRGWVEDRGEWREVIPGALLWHVSGECTIGRSDWENPYQCLAIRFDLPVPRRERVVPRFTGWSDPEEIQRFAREAIRWRVDGAFSDEALLQFTHGTLLFQAQLWLRRQGGGETLPPRLHEALEWMLQSLDQPLPLQKIAKKVGWSASHLHEVFRHHLGVTPHRFLLERRLQRAKERLTGSNDSVKEVAAATGFSSAAAFCHAFRQQVGLTPLAYRREMVSG